MNKDFNNELAAELAKAIDAIPTLAKPSVIELLIMALQAMLPKARQEAFEMMQQQVMSFMKDTRDIVVGAQKEDEYQS